MAAESETTAQEQLLEQEEIAGFLGIRILQSERLRAAALLAISLIFIVIIGVVASVSGLLPHDKEPAYRAALGVMAVVLFCMGAYEAVAWAWLGRRMHERKPVPIWVRYLNALVEIAWPTFIIWDWSGVAGPLQTLGGVLPWIYLLFIAASALHLDQRLCWFIGLAAAVSFCTVAVNVTHGQVAGATPLLVSPTSYVLKGIMMLIGGAVAAFVAGQLKQHLFSAAQSARERDRAIGIFGQHVSPQVARRLIDQKSELMAERRHVCVLFLDIRGFSSMAAERTPAEVMDYLNELFAPMITIVNQHGGIVNKFLGDGFMAIFGAPFEDPALHRKAVHCSLALLECVEQFNKAGSLPHTRIGIGLHAGDAMAGTVGSKERKEYTLLGDTVNAAARIEQETKRLGAQVIASEAVLQGLVEETQQATELGEVVLRGISTPLRLYRLA